jgi:plasmid stabilization system protein ParE
MQFELFISPVALNESMDAYDFYETKSIGLGERFLNSLESTYQKITHFPKSYSYISSEKDLRDVKVIDFPFVVIFQIINKKIIILRVFNTNRKPPNKY